jgi:hypothetical protein
MRFIKIFSLTAVMALAAMALVGASSALAEPTALCTVNESPCTHIYTGHIEGKALNPELAGKFFGIKGTFTCEHSFILGNALGLGSPQVTHFESISFLGNCHLLAPLTNVACTAIESKALGLVDLLKTAANLGVATFLNTTIFMHCGSLLECVLGGEPQFHALGSEGTGLASLTAAAAVVKNISGANCPEGESGRLKATYSILLPDPIYIAE